MKSLVSPGLMLIALLIAGCERHVAKVENPNNTTPEKGALSPKSSAETEAELSSSSKDYVVLNAPWNEYFRSEPEILIVPKVSKGIEELLKQEQELIKSVLNSGGKANTSSEYTALEDRLEELKTIIPQAETSSGYVRRSRRYGNYSYASGGTIYVHSYRYYDGHYTVLRERSLSSSPAMTRSVEGIAHNATLEDLDQRIEALQQTQRLWNRKTAEMSTTGTEGIMREANDAYLKGLQEYTNEFLKIRKDLRTVEQKQEAISRNRGQILSQWHEFEENSLPILDGFFQTNASDVIVSTDKNNYNLPDFSQKKLLYACEIGERTLYFDLSSQRSDLHPFVLIDVAPIQ